MSIMNRRRFRISSKDDSMTAGIYELTLSAPDGRERKTLAWFPNEAVRQDFLRRAAQRGLEVTEKPLNNNNV